MAATVLACVSTSFLCLVFVRALIHKLGAFEEFVGTVRDYRLVPWPRAAAHAIVAAELIVVLGLFWSGTRQIAVLVGALLLAIYAAAIGINLRRGRTSIDCGCGGGGQGISPLHLIRNAVLIGFTVPAVLFDTPPLPHVGAAFVAAGTVLLLWLTFLAFEQLLGNGMHAAASSYSALSRSSR